MYDIFKDEDDVIALVEGSPGIGKTTFCLKIAHDWAKERIPKEYSFPEFEIVLLLKCRDIDGDIMEAIDEQLLPERMEETVKKELMDYIEDFHYQEKVLIILDGLDELPKKSESQVDRLLHKKILPFCYVLVTSRQERGIVVRKKVGFDILLQIEGFTKKDAFEYIRKHFRNAGAEHLPKGEKLIEEIRKNDFLDALLNNPLNLLLLCVVFEDYQGELPSVRTELYQIIVRCLLRRYCAKHNLEAPKDDKALEQLFEDSLLVLGELAWRCLEEYRFSFAEEELARFERSNKDLAARKLGLVFKEVSSKKVNPQHEYHFFHKTFQEYLAALYLAHMIEKKKTNVFQDLQLKWFMGIVQQYRQAFLFVSGILGEDASVLFGQIGEMLESEGWDWHECSDQEATFFIESFNESRNAEQVAMTLCSFVPFPLTVEIAFSDDIHFTGILSVANACKNFSQLQHPLHLTVPNVYQLGDNEVTTIADFLISCPQLETLCLSSFTDGTQGSLSSDSAICIGNSLAANKTLRTVTFKLRDERGEAWANALETGVPSDTPLPSVVLKIYGSMSDTAIQALKTVLSNKSLTSLDLIIYGDMTDSQAAAVGEKLAAEAILKSLTLIVYGKLSYAGAVSLKIGFKENTSLNSLKVKVFGELPENWGTITENELMARKSFVSVTVHPNIAGKITTGQMVPLCPGLELHSLTLNLWGELRCNEAETLCKLLIESSTCVTLNMHGRVTDDVADCFLRYLKLCKTLSSLRINIWGELTRDGNSALQQLCNQRDSFSLSVCGTTSDDCIFNHLDSTINFPFSLTPVFTKVKETLTSKLSLNITNHGDATGDGGHGLRDGLAENTSLTTLSLTFNDCSDMSEDWGHGLGDGLAENTSLTTLSLTFNDCSELIGDWARGLGDGLAENTSLTTLSLTFNDCSELIGDWARGLGDGLAENTSLTTLSLTFNDCSELIGDWARGLGDGLAENTSLTTLSLTFNDCSELIGDWARGLGDGLAENTSLTTLSRTFNDCSDMSEDWGHGLGDGLAKNTSLTTLSLTFNDCSDMSEDWGHGLGDGLAENTSLTTLSLTFNDCSELIGDWARGLGDGLAENTSLTTLSLTFNDCSELIGDWARGLGDGLAENTSLTTLSLTFNHCSDMIRDWARGLGGGLVENTSLTTLSLTFNNLSDMRGDWARGLGDGLAKNTSLATLSLTFNNLSDMRGDWARGLGDGLAENTSLTTLSLTFIVYSELIGDWGRGLGDGLAKNTSLTTLSLTFNVYSELIGDWTCGLSDGLAKNASLTTLSLTFNVYSELIGDWTCGLGDGLAKNTSLTTLSLVYNNCSGTSGDWLNNLWDSLAKSDSIATLSFTIYDHGNTSSLLGCDLGRRLANCKSLTIVNLTVSLYGEAIGC